MCSGYGGAAVHQKAKSGTLWASFAGGVLAKNSDAPRRVLLLSPELHTTQSVTNPTEVCYESI